MPWPVRMVLLISLPLLLTSAYVGWRMHRAVRILRPASSRTSSRVIIALGVFINLLPLVVVLSSLMGATVRMPSILTRGTLGDLLLLYPFWIGVIFVGQLVPYLLVVHGGEIILRRTGRCSSRHEKGFAALTLALIAGGLVYIPLRALSDTHTLRIREITVPIRKDLGSLNELRLVHISDLQRDDRTDAARVREFVRRVNRLQPDLVVFSGDLVTSGTRYIDEAARLLGEIRSRFGVYACIGDHDYWADPGWIRRSLEEQGIIVLEDETRLVPIGSATLNITGVTNIYRRRPSRDILDRVAAGRDAQALALFLTHQPTVDLVWHAAEKGYDLFLAGHTHGGQVVFNYFGYRACVSNRETSFVSGFFRVGSMLVSVTNGLGLTLAPIRFHAPAEITLIRVIPSRAAGGR